MTEQELANIRSPYLANINVLKAETEQRINSIQEELNEISYRFQTDKSLSSDRSENMDFQILKDKQDAKTSIRMKLESRLDAISNRNVNYIHTGDVKLDSVVHLSVKSIDKRPPVGNTSFDFMLVEHELGDPVKKLVAIDSLVGKSILGKLQGETAIVFAPKGRIEYLIERVY